MRESHLTLRAPAMPGATTRTGKPWSADSSLRAAAPAARQRARAAPRRPSSEQGCAAAPRARSARRAAARSHARARSLSQAGLLLGCWRAETQYAGSNGEARLSKSPRWLYARR